MSAVLHASAKGRYKVDGVPLHPTHGNFYLLPQEQSWEGPSLSSVGALSGWGGHRSRVRALLVPDFPPGTVGSLLNYVASHAWSHKGIATRPSPMEPWMDRAPMEPWMDSVISRRTRFDLSVVVGLFVYV